MKKIKYTGTVLLCIILFCGMLTVFSDMIAYNLRLGGQSGKIINMLTANASVNLQWYDDLQGSTGRYVREKSLSEKYISLSDGIINYTESFCTGSFPGTDIFAAVSDFYRKNIMHCELTGPAGEKSNYEIAMEAADYVTEFADWAKDNDMQFMYVQIPAVKPDGKEYASDIFADIMMESDVDFIDITDYQDMFTFETDDSKHWLTKDALKATSVICEQMNERFGCKYDLSKFDSSLFVNGMDMSPQLKDSIKEEFGYEYELLIPKDSPSYEMELNDEKFKKGLFSDTLLKDVSEWDERKGNNSITAYHNMWEVKNNDYAHIKNTSKVNNEGKKVIVMGDSFSRPVVAYISMDTEDTFIFHPAYFKDDAKTYILYNKADIIVWIYNSGQIGTKNKENLGVVN